MCFTMFMDDYLVNLVFWSELDGVGGGMSPGVMLRWFHAMKCLGSSGLSFLIICGCFPKVMWVIFQNVLSGQWRFKCERGRV